MMLQRIVGRRLFLLHFETRTLQYIRSCVSSNGSIQQQAAPGHVGSKSQKLEKISQMDDDAVKFQIKMCNSLSEVSSFVSSQGERLSSSYIHDLLRQVRGILNGKNGKQFEGDNAVRDFQVLLTKNVLNDLTHFSLKDLSSLMDEITVLESAAKSDLVADKLSEQVLVKLDTISPAEFECFLQFLCSEEQVYSNLKSCIPNCDKLLTEKCLALITGEHFASEIGPSLVLALAKLGLDFRVHPAPILFQQIFRNVESYSIETISILGQLISHLKWRTSWYASRLIRNFQIRFDEVCQPSHLARLIHSTILLCSPDFKLKAWKKFQDVFHPSAVVEIDASLSMMQASMFFDHEVKVQILERCSELMVSQVGQMTVHQMVQYLSISQQSFFKLEPLYQEVFGKLENSVSLLTTRRDIVFAMDLLFRQSRGSKDFGDLIDRFTDVVDFGGTENLSKICAIATRLRIEHPELVTRVKRKCLKELPSVQDEALLNSLARFLKLKSSAKSPEVSMLKEKLTTASYKTINPPEHSCVLTGFGKLGTSPSHIDPFVWSKMTTLLPNLGRESSRMLFMMLGQDRYFKVNPVDHEQLCNLQREIFRNVLTKRPPKHLLLGFERIPFSRQNSAVDCDPMEGIHGSMKGERQDGITKANVVGVALYLHHTNMFYQDLVDRVAETVHAEVDWFTPYELKDVLNFLASSNSTHWTIEVISQRFATNLVEFFDMFSPFFVVESALYLARLQFFDRNLLDKIFTWQFLENLERFQPSAFSSHILMQLNRAVCLEFPEMQVPWFHHEIDTPSAFKKSRWNALKTDVYEALTEILGGDRDIRTQSRTDYNLLADFEFSYKKDDVNCTLHSSSTWNDTDKVTIDILPKSCYFKNAPQLRGEFAMKKRHLEILGYRYIPIPQQDFGWSLRPFRSDKVDYLQTKLSSH